MESNGECLVCGHPIKYLNEKIEMECVYCHDKFMSNASCEDNHYVCDNCHSSQGIESIMKYCENSTSKNPVEIMEDMMKNQYIYMHGPEHHVLVGAALLTAYHNSGGEVDFEKALLEMKVRGEEYPGGSCGFWGTCGAAVSVGMFLSIITESTPLSGKSWGIINRGTANTLNKIGELGGPRCCKRNSFTAAITTAQYVEENFGVKMEIPDKIICEFYENNKQCIRRACPFNKINN